MGKTNITKTTKVTKPMNTTEDKIYGVFGINEDANNNNNSAGEIVNTINKKKSKLNANTDTGLGLIPNTNSIMKQKVLNNRVDYNFITFINDIVSQNLSRFNAIHSKSQILYIYDQANSIIDLILLIEDETNDSVKKELISDLLIIELVFIVNTYGRAMVERGGLLDTNDGFTGEIGISKYISQGKAKNKINNLSKDKALLKVKTFYSNVVSMFDSKSVVIDQLLSLSVMFVQDLNSLINSRKSLDDYGRLHNAISFFLEMEGDIQSAILDKSKDDGYKEASYKIMEFFLFKLNDEGQKVFETRLEQNSVDGKKKEDWASMQPGFVYYKDNGKGQKATPEQVNISSKNLLNKLKNPELDSGIKLLLDELTFYENDLIISYLKKHYKDLPLLKKSARGTRQTLVTCLLFKRNGSEYEGLEKAVQKLKDIKKEEFKEKEKKEVDSIIKVNNLKA